jgi:hypothetical protein
MSLPDFSLRVLPNFQWEFVGRVEDESDKPLTSHPKINSQKFGKTSEEKSGKRMLYAIFSSHRQVKHTN